MTRKPNNSKGWPSPMLLILKLSMTTLFLAGCGDPYEPIKKLYQPSPDTDVTTSPMYNFASFSGTVWETKVKTAIVEGERYTGAPETKLLAPHRYDPTEPDYIPPIPSLDGDTITLVPAGTRLRIERLMKDNGAWGGVQVTATVEVGTNTQKTVFLDNHLLTIIRYGSTGTNWSANPEMLEPVRNTDRSAPSGLETTEPAKSGHEKGLDRGRRQAILALDARRGIVCLIHGGEIRSGDL